MVRRLTRTSLAALLVMCGCQTAPQVVAESPTPHAEVAPAFACVPTCYPQEAVTPPGCSGSTGCESRGSGLALALNVAAFRLAEAQRASDTGDQATCQAAARAVLLAVRGLEPSRARHPEWTSGDFVTSSGERWTETAAMNVLGDLAADASALYRRCGGAEPQTTPQDELAFYGAGASVPAKSPAPVEEIVAITLEGPRRVCPGEEPAYSAIFQLASGAKQRAAPALVRFSASVGAFFDNVYHLPSEPAQLLGAPPVLQAAPLDGAGPTASLTLKLDFTCARVVNMRGQEGRKGAPGTPGERPAANAGWGPRALAGNGGVGGPGEDAPPVHVYVASVAAAVGRLALVRVASARKQELHLVDPLGAPLVIDASGGSGGPGGEGGEGFRGDPGDDAPISGASRGAAGGMGGPGGSGGRGGNGGRGGSVTLHLDRRYPELQRVVKVINDGGDAGPAGAPGPGGNGGHGGFGSLRMGTPHYRGGETGDDGFVGPEGAPGTAGRPGPKGPTPVVVIGEAAQMFSAEVSKGVKLEPPR